MISSAADWPVPPAHPALRAGEPHVWRAALDLDAPRLAEFQATLSADECERAARFHFERDRSHFIAARGFLRELLSGYLDCPAAALHFSYGPRGKPALAAPAANLSFNLSHAHGLALFAFARGAALGVDIEHVRAGFATADIAERFFSPREQSSLRALPAAQRAEGFFNGWTRKEAYIKATGDGLAIPLDSFDVTLAPGEAPRLLAVRAADALASRWSLYDLSPGPDFAAALVVAGGCSAPLLFAIG